MKVVPPSDGERRALAYQLAFDEPAMGWALQTLEAGVWKSPQLVRGSGAGRRALTFLLDGPATSRPRGLQAYPDDPGTSGMAPPAMLVVEDGTRVQVDQPWWERQAPSQWTRRS